jgi:hypothetical protein
MRCKPIRTSELFSTIESLLANKDSAPANEVAAFQIMQNLSETVQVLGRVSAKPPF